jgi:membrane protein
MWLDDKKSVNEGALRMTAAAVAGILMAALRARRASPTVDRLSPSLRADHAGGAERPENFGRSAWRNVLWRTYTEFSNDRVLLVAAGITFYGLLALFPALTALVSIAGVMVEPNTIVDQLRSFSGVVPEAALDIVGEQMQRIASQPTNHLSFAFVAGLAIAIWSANNGIKAMFEGLNVVYDEDEERSFLRLNGISLMFTLGAIVMMVVALGAIAVVPAILAFVGLPGISGTLISLGRWPILFAIIIVGIGLLYRFGPSRTPPQWRWISVGSGLAAALWVAASAIFSWYVANFNSYNQTYGSLGAVIAFMVWIWISASIILLGAELNAELEHQTVRDTIPNERAKRQARGGGLSR